MVIGSPGAGKSTFSRRLQKKTNLPIVYLDQLFWKSDKTTVSPEEFTSRLKSKMQTDTWIMDGNYSKYMFDERLSACDTVFFLDYDVHACLKGVRQRREKNALICHGLKNMKIKLLWIILEYFPKGKSLEL